MPTATSARCAQLWAGVDKAERDLVTTCPSCSRSVVDELLACPSCGAALTNSATPTRMPHTGDNAERQAAP
ncbi:MAG TPA: hypothetical protein VNS63_11820, partial [Blastocatellia bacterium]|nr:hypothetical protein [Blastocatellia bacterium]